MTEIATMLVEDREMTATEIAEAFDAEVIADLLSHATPGSVQWTILSHAAAQNPVQCSCEGPFPLDELRAILDFLDGHGAIDGYRVEMGEPLRRGHVRLRDVVRAIEDAASSKPVPTESQPLHEGEDVEATLGRLTPEDTAARLRAIEHADAQGGGES